MSLTPKLISECTSNSNFSANHEDNENDQDNENYRDNEKEGNLLLRKQILVQSQQQKKSSGVFMISFEHIWHLVF